MRGDLRAAIAERMNRLDAVGVTWDRCIPHDDQLVAYGFSTSSAPHSSRISELLHGPAASHAACQRVEDVFGALVSRKVELP